MRPQTLLLFISSLAALPACTGKDGDSGTATPAAPTSAVVWGGWTHTWELLNHRVSLIEAILDDDETMRMGLVGGDWSTGENATDTPWYRMRVQQVSALDFAVISGETELAVGPEGSVTETVSISAPDVAALPNAIIALRGISLNTDTAQSADYPSDYDPALGYTSQGFGFSVGAPTIADDSVSFDVSAAIRWGFASEDDPIDRSDMNGAIPHATTAVTVAWTVIGFSGTAIDAATEGSVDHPHDPPYSEQLALGSDDLPVSIGAGGGPGFAILRAFDLGVEVPGAPDDGEYLRSFGVELIPADSASEPISVQAEVTNSSFVETGAIRFSPTIDLSWVELDDAAAAVTPLLREGSHAVGRETITPQ